MDSFEILDETIPDKHIHIDEFDINTVNDVYKCAIRSVEKRRLI